VPVFVLETRSQQAEAILRGADEVCVSSLTRAEFLIALNRLRKLGKLPEVQHDVIVGTLDSQIQEGLLRFVALESRHFEQAVDLARQSGPILRTLDALHLAMAKSLGARLATFDDRLAAAAKSVDAPIVV